MRLPGQPGYRRRGFLKATAAAVASIGGLRAAVADEHRARGPARAISGDRTEPNWAERLTVTVGPAKADIAGADQRALQAAVDYVAGLGGGTVHVLPGTYRLRNSVFLRSNVRLLGSGEESVLHKEPSLSTRLDAESDWYDQEITLVEASGFRLGDGICLRTRNPHHGGTDIVKRTLVARSANRFKLDRALRQNFWRQGDTTAASLFPLLSGEEIADVLVENLTLDGNKQNNENLDGNYAGCIFLQDCSRVTIRNVTARNYNGDGISWQVCHDVSVEGCRSHDHTGLGLHPGSGSQRTTMRNNLLHHNDIGIFFCWGVQDGLAEGNRIEDNRSCAVSIGHRDTDNRIVNNTIRRSGQVGVLFRVDGGPSFAPHRNQVEQNQIEDSGPQNGIGIDVQGETEGVTIARNSLLESRGPEKRIGIRIGAQTRDIRLADNKLSGFATEVADLRRP